MANYQEYAQRIVNAIQEYGETVNLKYRVSKYDSVRGEVNTYRRYRNWRVFIRPTDQSDWQDLPDGLNIKDVRKMYFTKQMPKKELVIERLQDGHEYEIIVPPVDNYFDGINFYYKCFIALKEVQNNDID